MKLRCVDGVDRVFHVVQTVVCSKCGEDVFSQQHGRISRPKMRSHICEGDVGVPGECVKPVPKKFRSLNSCFRELGVPEREVRGRNAVRRPGAGSFTFRQRHKDVDLKLWAKKLYKARAAELHPDLHSGPSRAAYEVRFKNLQAAYVQAEKILNTKWNPSAIRRRGLGTTGEHV